jgi:predicted GIY-YIG superfamily endonuclease
VPIVSSQVVAAEGVLESKHASTVEVVRDAYLKSSDGWSTDEVLLQDDLNKAFLLACRQLSADEKPNTLNWALLNLRKAGKLKGIKTERRRRDDHSRYGHLAEIAARNCQDKFKVSTDRIMCDPQLRRAFDLVAKQVAPKIDPYLMRKAAFGLRKARRLQPELVLRIADWDREISTHNASEIAKDLERIPDSPGVYIFSDPTGYLYVGESVNLRKRLGEHLDHSDRQSLASYLQSNGVKEVTVELHAFPKSSRAKKVSIRRAYESALIASRKPRFNVRP